MKSMTGYGKGIGTEQGSEVVIELRSVNNRFLEINSRLPKSFLACDELIRGMISKSLTRGSVDVFFSYSNTGSEGSVSADLPLIGQYLALAQKINTEYRIPNDITFTSLMSKGLISAQTEPQNSELMLQLVRTATLEAIKGLNIMRQTEGETIQADLSRLVSELESCAMLAKERSPFVVDEYRKKLKERISEYLSDVAVDESRLLTEVAFFADKSDINEELSRLFSHLMQFRDTLLSSDASGRKLDFISQEIGREINTLGSKSNDITLTGYAVEMKNILEKIKEQIRNVE